MLLQEDNVKFVIRDSYYKDKVVHPLNKQIVHRQIQVVDAKYASMDFTIIMDFAYNALIPLQDLFAILINNIV